VTPEQGRIARPDIARTATSLWDQSVGIAGIKLSKLLLVMDKTWLSHYVARRSCFAIVQNTVLDSGSATPRISCRLFLQRRSRFVLDRQRRQRLCAVTFILDRLRRRHCHIELLTAQPRCQRRQHPRAVTFILDRLRRRERRVRLRAA
jgi:hypothetical protein